MPTYVIYDDGPMGLVDGAAYRGFVSEQWELDQICEHFVAEMAAGRGVFWAGVPDGARWRVAVNEPVDGAVEEFTAPITATGAVLHLVNYDALAMAAQFADGDVRDPANGAVVEVAVAPGRYLCRVARCFEPDQDWDALTGQQSPHFVVTLTPAAAQGTPEPPSELPWW